MPYVAAVEKRRELFEAFNKFVSEQGGWIVSSPGAKRIRIETPENSSLPIRLAEQGIRLHYVGTGTRNAVTGIVPVDLIEITLPRII